MAWDKEKRNATQQKYHHKHQKKYFICFHTEKDKKYIDFIENQKAEGLTPSQVFKQLLDNQKQHL